jgi:hypothetical protein
MPPLQSWTLLEFAAGLRFKENFVRGVAKVSGGDWRPATMDPTARHAQY